MLEIREGEGGTVVLVGRFDASQTAGAEKVLDRLSGRAVLDVSELHYISSAGLGVLLKTQKRLVAAGGGLRLVNPNRHLRDLFRFSGFDRIFEIEPGPGA